MLTFQLNLSQRDDVVNLFSQLNELIISDNLSLEKIKESAAATSSLIITLNNLMLTESEGECSPADGSVERPAKKLRSDAYRRDQIIFEINLEDLLQVIGQIMKNQKVAIRHSNLVQQIDKFQLLRENSNMIGKLQRLPLKTRSNQMDGADGGSRGSRPIAFNLNFKF